VEVRYDEGVAIRVGPEPCADIREGVGEASVGERIGQPLSRESHLFWTPTSLIGRKATRHGAPSRAPCRSGVVGDPGMCGSSLYGNREISRLTGDTVSLARIGKVRSRSR
jgi:hypothetical protein